MEYESAENIDIVLSHVGVDLLKQEASKHTGPNFYVNRLRTRYRLSAIYGLIMQAARLVEPEDRLFGVDKDLSKAQAFVTGALLGARVLSEFLSDDQKQKMFEIEIRAEDAPDSDESHEQHLLAQEIVGCSERGYAAATAYHELLEEWEDTLCPRVVDQPYYYRGFGFMIYLMQEASRSQQAEELEKQLQKGVDWEAALAEWSTEMPGDSSNE